MSNVVDFNQKVKEREQQSPSDEESSDDFSVYITNEKMYDSALEVLNTYEYVDEWSDETKQVFVDGLISFWNYYIEKFEDKPETFGYFMFSLEVLTKAYKELIKQELEKQQQGNSNDND